MCRVGGELVPNRLHERLLRSIQPHRKQEDVFPTVYKLNTLGAVRRYFGDQTDVHHYKMSGVPSYHFGRAILFRLQLLLQRLTPTAFHTSLGLFIRKR